jgi:hypothetical protein
MGEKRYSFTILNSGSRRRSTSSPCHFTPEETAPGTHCIGGWADPRTNLEIKKRKIACPCQEPNTNIYCIIIRPTYRIYNYIHLIALPKLRLPHQKASLKTSRLCQKIINYMFEAVA